MATIGLFTRAKTGGFTGTIRTLTCNTKATIVPVATKAESNQPDFRIYAGQVDLGAAWTKSSERGREYLSVALDDPSFAQPLHAALVPVEGDANVFALIWTRR